jgi:hypothetical protein
MEKLPFRFALMMAPMRGDGSGLISATQTLGKSRDCDRL